MNLKNILGTNAYWQVNKKIALATSIESAILLSELVDQFEFWKANGKLEEDNFFYCTTEKITERIGVTYKVLTRLKNELESVGLIETKVIGLPAKTHYKINTEGVMSLLLSENKIEQNGKQGIEEPEKTVLPKGENYNCPKGHQYNNIYNNNILINNIDEECAPKKLLTEIVELWEGAGMVTDVGEMKDIRELAEKITGEVDISRLNEEKKQELILVIKKIIEYLRLDNNIKFYGSLRAINKNYSKIINSIKYERPTKDGKQTKHTARELANALESITRGVGTDTNSKI
jgi:hypothetical protein